MINISSFFFVAKVFGLAPYTLQVERKHSRVAALLARVPTYLMIALYTGLVCSVFFKQKAVSEILNTANWFQFIPNATIFFIVLVAAESSHLTIQSVGILIHELDEGLKFFSVSFDGSYKRTRQLSLFALLLVICCGSIVAILHYVISVDWELTASVFYWLAFVIGKIGLLTFNFMFALYMTVLLERLKLVEKTIELLIKVPIYSFIDDFKNVTPIGLIHDTLPIKRNEALERIYDIIEILQKICAKLNSYYGKKVIFTILTAFICLTVQLFHLINNIRHGFQSSNAVIGGAASCSLIFMHILELWVIFISGHRVKDMWMDMIQRVQDSKRRFAGDEKFKAQIDELVTTMVFTRIEIKAAGLFSIDLSVITSIVSSIATYLVVLVQFKLSEEDGNIKTRNEDLQQYMKGSTLRDIQFNHT